MEFSSFYGKNNNIPDSNFKECWFSKCLELMFQKRYHRNFQNILYLSLLLRSHYEKENESIHLCL